MKDKDGSEIEFEPRFTIPDMKEYEAEEQQLIQTKARPLEFVELHARWVEKILHQSLAAAITLDIELTGHQAQESMKRLFAHFYGADDEGGDASPLLR